MTVSTHAVRDSAAIALPVAFSQPYWDDDVQQLSISGVTRVAENALRSGASEHNDPIPVRGDDHIGIGRKDRLCEGVRTIISDIPQWADGLLSPTCHAVGEVDRGFGLALRPKRRSLSTMASL